jgi:hypothetical protein
MALQKVSMIWSSEPMTLGSRRRASISAGSSSMPNSPLSQACTASLGASFRRDSKRCRSRMFWKYAHCRLQVQGAQRRQQHLPSAFAAEVCVNNWAGRRELDCEVVKESKTRYVCRLLSDGLLPRVRCFRSLTLTSTRPPFFPFLACLLFCREFDLLHAPETRMNSGGDFSTINKRDHFVESVGGRGVFAWKRRPATPYKVGGKE